MFQFYKYNDSGVRLPNVYLCNKKGTYNKTLVMSLKNFNAGQCHVIEFKLNKKSV